MLDPTQPDSSPQTSKGSHWFAWAGLAAALLVLAATIAISTLQLRNHTRKQIARRDADILHAIASHQLSSAEGDELTAVLESSTQKGVIAVRVFDPRGGFSYSIPARVSEASLAPADVEALIARQAVGRFHEQYNLDQVFLAEAPAPPPAASPATPAAKSTPILEVLVPLHSESSKGLLAIAQYLIEGESIGREFAELDANLTRQSMLAFAGGGAVLVLALGWALLRLRTANDALELRTGTLLRANRELAMAAKSSAIGAVASHLIHGLKNPLAGLQQFVTRQALQQTKETENEWFHAVATTKRMQIFIADIVRVLREEEGVARYEITTEELAQIVATRVKSAAHAAGVEFKSDCQFSASFNNKDANLISLIIENLAHNAIEASPRGSAVLLIASQSATGLSLQVHDQGPGLTQAMRASLFTAVQSQKPGGTGIGLAISKQLATHLGAELRLKSDAPTGCVFELLLAATHSSGRWVAGNTRL